MNIKLLNQDCMEVMSQYPDKYFDLAVVDPPYGININMNAGRRKDTAGKKRAVKNWDNAIPGPEYFAELKRVSKDQIIWGGNYFDLPSTAAWIFWDKDIAEGVSFGDGELAWTSFDKVLRKVRIQYSGFIGADSDGRFHPTQKPIKLYYWTFNNYAKADFKILDTHLGSASSAIAANQIGIAEFVGCELDKDYYQAAVKRFNQVTAQQALFSAPAEVKQPSQVDLMDLIKQAS